MKNKKENITRVLTALLGLSLAITSLSGCTKPSEQQNDKTVLRYVMMGPGKQEDSDTVWEKVNEEIQKKIPNVEVEFEIIPIAEYNQKFMLMLASSEQIDIANTYGLSFSEEVRNGTFADMTELLDEYGKDIKAALPDYIFDYTTFDGRIYGIPTYQMLCVPQGLKTHKALAEQYLDIDGLKNELNSNARVTDKTFEILTEYMKNLKEAGKKYDGPQNTGITANKGFDKIVDNYGYYIDDEKCTVYYIYDTDEYRKEISTWHNWLNSGYLRPDIKTTDEWNTFLEDGWTLWNGNYEPWMDENESKKYGFDVMNICNGDDYFVPMANSAGATAIMQMCENKELAMQVINLIQTDKDIYNLLVYGIEGEHYTKVNDEKIELNGSGEYNSNAKYGLWKWVVGNTQLAYLNQSNPDNYKEWVFDEINSTELKSPLVGFQPDITNISDDISQVQSIWDEYYYSSRDSGNIDRYNEWMEKISLAGNQRVIDELQRQVNEYLSNK